VRFEGRVVGTFETACSLHFELPKPEADAVLEIIFTVPPRWLGFRTTARASASGSLGSTTGGIGMPRLVQIGIYGAVALESSSSLELGAVTVTSSLGSSGGTLRISGRTAEAKGARYDSASKAPREK
jgi:hypothetical protein